MTQPARHPSQTPRLRSPLDENSGARQVDSGSAAGRAMGARIPVARFRPRRRRIARPSPIEPEQPLLVHAVALPFQQDTQAPIAEPAALSPRTAQALAHLRVASFRLAARRLRIDLGQPAGALLQEAALCYQTKLAVSALSSRAQACSQRQHGLV